MDENKKNTQNRINAAKNVDGKTKFYLNFLYSYIQREHNKKEKNSSLKETDNAGI